MSNIVPKISVIISAYNHEKYVKDAILSVVNQTFESLELLVIDDGSTDDTWNQINSLYDICKKRFINVVFKKQENKGTCFTINKLLEMSTGEYIFGLASDDIVVETAIEIFHEFLSHNKEYALVVGKNKFIDENGKICYWDEGRNVTYDINAKYKSFSSYLEKNKKDIDFDSDQFGTYETLFNGNYIPNGYLIRKNIYQLTGLFKSEAPLEDYWLMLQISKFSKMKFIRKTTFYYRCHATNSIKNHIKMDEMTRKTRQYEYSLITSKYREIYINLSRYFYDHSKKHFFNSKLFKVYKTRSIENKLFCIEIANYVFKIKYKNTGIF